MTADDTLTKHEAKLVKYIENLADLMGLKEWSFGLGSSLLKNDEALARIETVRVLCTAVIEVNELFWETDAAQQRKCIVHELLHIYFSTDRIMTGLENQLTRSVMDLFVAHAEIETEIQVDRLAKVIAPFFPEPKPFKKVKK